MVALGKANCRCTSVRHPNARRCSPGRTTTSALKPEDITLQSMSKILGLSLDVKGHVVLDTSLHVWWPYCIVVYLEKDNKGKGVKGLPGVRTVSSEYLQQYMACGFGRRTSPRDTSVRPAVVPESILTCKIPGQLRLAREKAAKEFRKQYSPGFRGHVFHIELDSVE